MGSSLSSVWTGWGPSDSKADDPYKLYVKSVLDAIEHRNLEKLKELNESPSLKKFGGIENITASSLLHKAVDIECEEIIKYLIQVGVDVDQTNITGMTALHLACKSEKFLCVQELINRTKDIDKRDVWGRTALMKALVFRNEKAAKLLLERGANPNAIDCHGMTPLTTAIDYNMPEMIIILVNHGADINMVTVHQHGFSGPPLYLAVINQNVEVVNQLIQLGAITQPRKQDYSDEYPGTAARYKGGLQHQNVVMLAMAVMVKKNAIDMQGPGMAILTALIAAHGYPLGSSPDVIIRLLINSQPDDFSMLLHKLQICSSNSQDELLSSAPQRENNRLMPRSKHLYQIDHHLHSSGSRSMSQQVISLQNQARRMARLALMRSGRNVVWAAQRLQCPPALKSLLMLKDIDRAFSPGTLTVKSSSNTTF